VCDDTDVFALLLFFYSSEKLQSSLSIQSPIQRSFCIDITESALQYAWIVPEILAFNVLKLWTHTACDGIRWSTDKCEIRTISYGIGRRSCDDSEWSFVLVRPRS